MTWQIVSTSSGQTEQLGEAIGSKLRGGETIELVSDLGGGKTTFVRGLARGAGSHDTVASPTFTISRAYTCADFTMLHFDFYRLSEPGLVALELAEVLDDKTVVTVVEWADAIRDVLPGDRVTIVIAQQQTGDRLITIQYTPDRAYLLGDTQ